jgi:hypothetical protein
MRVKDAGYNLARATCAMLFVPRRMPRLRERQLLLDRDLSKCRALHVRTVSAPL